MLFNDQYSSAYDDIVTYYPTYYAQVREMQAVLKAEGDLIDDVKNGMETVFSDCFISTADSTVLAEYESIMGLDSAGKTIEERRSAVKARLVSSGRLSAKMISDMIRQYTGRETYCLLAKEEDLVPYDTLMIMPEIDPEQTFDISEVEALISDRLPAHTARQLSPAITENINIHTEISAYDYDMPMSGQYLCGQAIPF